MALRSDAFEVYLGQLVGAGLLAIADTGSDGILDVITGSPCTQVGGVMCAGAVSLWRGGAALTGVRTPDALLTRADPVDHDLLGTATGLPIAVADVTGDGRLDLAVAAQTADVNGVVDVGAVLFWSATSLLGVPPPDRFMTLPGLLPYSFLCR